VAATSVTSLLFNKTTNEQWTEITPPPTLSPATTPRPTPVPTTVPSAIPSNSTAQPTVPTDHPTLSPTLPSCTVDVACSNHGDIEEIIEGDGREALRVRRTKCKCHDNELQGHWVGKVCNRCKHPDKGAEPATGCIGTEAPTESPSKAPTKSPTEFPSARPSPLPTDAPTDEIRHERGVPPGYKHYELDNCVTEEWKIRSSMWCRDRPLDGSSLALASYAELDDAKNECTRLATCFGVYRHQCNADFSLCKEKNTWSPSSNGGCVYEAPRRKVATDSTWTNIDECAQLCTDMECDGFEYSRNDDAVCNLYMDSYRHLDEPCTREDADYFWRQKAITAYPTGFPTTTRYPTSYPTDAPTPGSPSTSPSASPSRDWNNTLYTFHLAKCVIGQTLRYLKTETAHACSLRCDSKPKCAGFEYYGAYGADPGYGPDTCNLVLSNNTDGCHGKNYNLDFYEKIV